MTRIFLALLLFLAQGVSAADFYYWQSNIYTNTFDNPSLACNYIRDQSLSIYPSAYVKSLAVRPGQPSVWDCSIYRIRPSGAHVPILGSSITRYGNSCPDETTYNALTGSCTYEGEPCVLPGNAGAGVMSGGVCRSPFDPDTSKEAYCKYQAGTNNVPKKFKYVRYPDRPGDARRDEWTGKSGCVYKPSGDDAEQCTDVPAECARAGEGITPNSPGNMVCSEHYMYCTVTMQLTGDAEEGSTDPKTTFCEGEACNIPEPENTTQIDPCKYGLNPAGGQTCTSKEKTSQDGTTNCGVVNGGEYKCYSTVPSANGIEIVSDVKSEALPDGKTKETKTDTAYQYQCGQTKNSCVTSKTTNITTTIKNGDGSVDTVTGSCKGAACPDSNTNPDANGDGFGDCVKDCGEDDEEQQGTASASTDCEVPPPCSGDEFQCAILAQVHYNSCAERAEPTIEERQAAEAQIDEGYAKLEEAQGELDDSVVAAFSDFQAGASGNNQQVSGPCLADKQFNFLGNSITLPFSMVCEFLALFRMALLAIAYLAAARIIHTVI